MELPSCMTGFVYFLISRDHPNETYIGQGQDINHRLRKHNSGNGAEFTKYYPPYAVFAYVCGFDGNKPLRLHFEKEWKKEVTRLIGESVNCVICWALVADKIIEIIKESHNFDLRLVMLFHPKDYVD